MDHIIKYNTFELTISVLKTEITKLNSYLKNYIPYSSPDTFDDFIKLFDELKVYDLQIKNKYELLHHIDSLNLEIPILHEFCVFMKESENKKNNHYYQKQLINIFLSTVNKNNIFVYKPHFYLIEFHKFFNHKPIWTVNNNRVSPSTITSYLNNYISFIFTPSTVTLTTNKIAEIPQTYFISSYTEKILEVNQNEQIFNYISKNNFSSFFSKLHSIRYLSLHYSRNVIELYSLLLQHNNHVNKDISELSYLEYSIFRYYYHYYSIHLYQQILEKFLQLYSQNNLILKTQTHHFDSLSDSMINNIFNDQGLTLPINGTTNFILKHPSSTVDTRNIKLQHLCLFSDFLLFNKTEWNSLINQNNIIDILKISLLRSIFSSHYTGEVNINHPNCLNSIINNLSTHPGSKLNQILSQNTLVHRFKSLCSKYATSDSIINSSLI